MSISEDNNSLAGMQEDDAAVAYETESCFELENDEWDTNAVVGVNYLPESKADDQAEYECFGFEADIAEVYADDQVDFQTDCQTEADPQAECAVADQANASANTDSAASDRKKTASAGRISYKGYLELVGAATAKYAPENRPDSMYEVSLEEFDYFWTLFAGYNPKYDEEVVFWAGDRHESYTLKELMNFDFFKQVLETFPAEDLFVSIEGYKVKHKLKYEHVFAQLSNGEARDALIVEHRYCDFSNDSRFETFVIGVDVDYKRVFEEKGLQAQCSPEAFYYYMMDVVGDHIPEPTYIECGHQLRLLYVLRVPIGNVTDAGMRLQRGADRLIKVICNNILAEFPDCGAEPQRKFIRMPGSVNSKDNSYVYVKKISDEKYTAQEYMEEYLPDLPLTAEEYWRRKAEREEKLKNGKLSPLRNTNWVNLEKGMASRIEDLKKLRQKPGIHREQLVFIYGTAYYPVNKGISREDFMEALYEFNDGFENPLTKKEIQTKCSGLYKKMTSDNPYKYKSETIIDQLNITDEDTQLYNLTIGMDWHLRQKLLKEERGEACWQKVARRTERIKHYYEEGFTREDIAKALKVSFATVRDTVVKLRKAMSKEELKLIRENQDKRKNNKEKLKTFIACEEMAKRKAEKEAEKARKKAEKEAEKAEQKRRTIEKAMRREAKDDDLRRRIAYTLKMEFEEVVQIYREGGDGWKELLKKLEEAERQESLMKRASWAKMLEPLFWMDGRVRLLFREYTEYEPRLKEKIQQIHARRIGGKLYVVAA